MVKQPSFLHELQEAVKNPTAEDSKKLLARITPHIHSCTPKIPFSPAQRKSSMKHIYSMYIMYGLPSIFYTFALDDTHGTLNIRLGIPQQDNLSFPATDDGFLQTLIDEKSEFKEIKIKENDLKILLAKGSFGAAAIFKVLSEGIFEILLGTPSEQTTKKTIPLPKREKGIFGCPVASFDAQSHLSVAPKNKVEGHCTCMLSIGEVYLHHCFKTVQLERYYLKL